MSETPSSPPVDPRTELASLARVTEEILSAALGASVRVGEPELLRDQARNRVARFPVTEGPADAPASVIVKTVEGQDENAYDPTSETPSGTTDRFFSEWSSNRFLTELGLTPALGARLYGGDRQAGVIVLEDLGPPHSLADQMVGEDRAALETALVQYAASMGRMHAATIGKKERLTQIRQECSGRATSSETKSGAEHKEYWELVKFREVCEKQGIMLLPGFEAEAEGVRRLLDEPGPFLAFKPGDTCPDNHRLMDDGWARFFDFEFAGFGHALLDAAYFYLPFPTCWCVNRLPEEQVARMETAYRQELARGCPDASDDTIFLPALAAACAHWAMATLAWGMESALKEDGRWGISTLRQRHPLRLENFARVAERAGTLPAMAETARSLASHLRALWAETEPMPFYPAFRTSE